MAGRHGHARDLTEIIKWLMMEPPDKMGALVQERLGEKNIHIRRHMSVPVHAERGDSGERSKGIRFQNGVLSHQVIKLLTLAMPLVYQSEIICTSSGQK